MKKAKPGQEKVFVLSSPDESEMIQFSLKRRNGNLEVCNVSALKIFKADQPRD